MTTECVRRRGIHLLPSLVGFVRLPIQRMTPNASGERFKPSQTLLVASPLCLLRVSVIRRMRRGKPAIITTRALRLIASDCELLVSTCSARQRSSSSCLLQQQQQQQQTSFSSEVCKQKIQISDLCNFLASIACTECIDAGRCYRMMYLRSVVIVYVGYDREPCKKTEPIDMPVGALTRVDPRKYSIG